MFSSHIYAVRQNTPASELVAASGNADSLCRERRAAENVSVKDLVAFPPLQVFLAENLEKNEIRRRSKSICFAYVILKWRTLQPATSFRKKTRADCKNSMRFQVSFMQSAMEVL